LSYQIYDSTGYIADLATNQGLRDLMEYLRQQDDSDISKLANDGEIEITPEVINKIKSIKASSEKNVNSTLEILKSNIDKVEDILIISDGMEPEEDSKARKPDFMDDERKAMEAEWQAELEKAFTATLAEFKKRIMKKKALFDNPSPFDDVINDEQMWEEFRVRIMSASQKFMRDGALQAAEYNALLGLGVDMDFVNKAVLDFTKTYMNTWWAGLEKTTREGMRSAFAAWQEVGLGDQGLPDLINALEPYFGASRARRIAVTETTRVFDEGNRLVHISAGIQYEQWQTAHDDLVCPICAPFDRQYFPTNAGPRPVTDSHPSCRCARISAANYNPAE